MKKILLLLTGLCFLASLNGQTIWTGALNSNWNDPGNWSAGIPTAGLNAQISEPATATCPVISSDLIIDFNVNNNCGIIIEAGVTVTITPVATIFNNAGPPTAIITNNGILINNGTFNNDGNFNNNGDFTNCGMLKNFGNGQITNGLTANFLNKNGTIINNFGAITNLGIFTNSGNIETSNVINNNGQFINNDILNIQFGSNFNNDTNGILDNNSVVILDAAVTINNLGTINNNSCAEIRQLGASPVNGTIVNNGIIYQLGSGTVNVTSGAGIILNVGQFPSPNALCQNISIDLDATGNASISANDVDAGSFASYCTIASRSLDISSFDCTNIGPNIVNLTVTDDLGNPASCTAMVTVVDPTPPVVNCPVDIIVNLGSGACEAIVDYNAPTATDLCGASVTQTGGAASGSSFPIGNHTISYEISDGTNTVDCSFDIIVLELANPISEIACNSLVHISLDENCQAVVGADMILEGGPYACYQNYIVDVDGTGSNIVDGSSIGDTLMVMVTGPNGNPCWGTIIVADELAPNIQCTDVSINCFEDSSPANTGGPYAPDNCDNNLTVSFTDVNQEIACDTSVIFRTWLVSDDSGNSATCIQTIGITRPALADVVFPANRDDISLPALDCSNPNTAPSNTGEPTLLGFSLDGICHYDIDYEDTQIDVCENSYKILREWKVIDWCNSTSITHEQTIKVLDKTPPTISCSQDVLISTDANNNCTASYSLPVPVLADDCSTNVGYTINTSAGSLVGNTIFGLPIGTTTVVYTATDDCGNSNTCDFEITVEDQISPIAICDLNTTVNLIGEPTLAPAAAFDSGSYDECGPVSLSVRRMNMPHCPGNDATAFGPTVPFNCCDVGNTVTVALRVVDQSGNENTCMVQVVVDDKLNPAISCPADISLDCASDYTDLLVTGEATAADNCTVSISHVDSGSIGNCGTGTITRIWTATDGVGLTASCLQKIYVINQSQINEEDIIWPLDYETNECGAFTDPSDLPLNYDQPKVNESTCDLVAVVYEDIFLPITPPACYKILRRWVVIDWCQYDENNPDGPGKWEHSQLIKVLNTEAPVITSDCNDLNFCSFDNNCQLGTASLLVTATDDCSDAIELNYSYTIDQYNDGSIDFTGNTSDASGDYALGTHKIKFTVEDGCGNLSTCEYLFTIEDCQLPLVYCYNGFAIELNPATQSVSVEATDFDAGSTDNCGIVDRRVASPSAGPGQSVPPATNSLTFGCGELGLQTVDFWVKDINGNWDYCSTYIIIEDNNEVCGNTAMATISGAIENEYGEEVEGVNVDLSGGYGVPYITGNNGQYGFPNLALGGNYTVLPEKDLNPINGVTTYDLVVMSKHILNIQKLDSPYKIIAADIDKSKSIGALDMIELRKLILHINTNFLNNKSWRFVDKHFVFPQMTNPFATTFPEIVSINNLPQDEQANFIGIKVGDLDGSAIPNQLLGAEVRNLEESLSFVLTDQNLEAGKTYQLDFVANNFDQILGYQFTLNFDSEAVEFIDIETGALDAMSLDNFGLTKIQEGAITTSWHRTTAVELDASEMIFRFSFKAKQSVQLKDIMDINSRYTLAQAYTDKNGTVEVLDVNLAFQTPNGLVQKETFELYQNQPNPFNTITSIGFNLPKAGPASLNIYDVSGKLIKSIEKVYEKGYHEVALDNTSFPSSGLFYYELKTEDHKATRKMILLK